MKIAIVGCGFVGSTYYDALKTVHDIHVIDPAMNNNALSDFPGYDGIIICVPTPSNSDGSCDYSLIIDVMDTVNVETTDHSIPILIKSTIDLEAWEHLTTAYTNPITFSPEFLRQKSATLDLKMNKYCILAGDYPNIWWKILTASPVFERKIFRYSINDVKETIIMKYAVNSFLATKVIFFNQLKEFCDDNDLSFDSVRRMVITDDRIGDSHTEVTEEGGFGGACFPKDTRAFSCMDKENRMSVLQQAIEWNEKL